LLANLNQLICDTLCSGTNNSVMTKINLLQKLFAKNNQSAEIDWDQVYEEVLPRVYNYFRYRFFNNDLAEELTAITLSRAWQSRNRYKKDVAMFSTWVLGIARHIALDEFRRRKADEFSLEDFEHIPSQNHVEGSVQTKHDLDELKAILLELSTTEQELIGLKYGAGLTNRAIAELTNLSESNVGTMLYRAVKKLRVKMEITV